MAAETAVLPAQPEAADFDVVPGARVDLIEPFPVSQINRIYGWMRSFKNVVIHDDFPHTRGPFRDFIRMVLASPGVRSWAVLDRDDTLGKGVPGAIIGIFMFEPYSSFNGFLHVASGFSAFGSGLMDEAAVLVFQELFDSQPKLQRLSAFIHEKNIPAQNIAKRTGFKKEGTLEDAILQRDEPASLVIMGLTRRRWEDLWDSSRQLYPQSAESSAPFSEVEAAEPPELQDRSSEPVSAPSDKAEAVEQPKPEKQPETSEPSSKKRKSPNSRRSGETSSADSKKSSTSRASRSSATKQKRSSSRD